MSVRLWSRVLMQRRILYSYAHCFVLCSGHMLYRCIEGSIFELFMHFWSLCWLFFSRAPRGLICFSSFWGLGKCIFCYGYRCWCLEKDMLTAGLIDRLMFANIHSTCIRTMMHFFFIRFLLAWWFRSRVQGWHAA